MAISYDKKIMECVLRSVMSEGNVAQGKAITSICKSPKLLFITGPDIGCGYDGCI